MKFSFFPSLYIYYSHCFQKYTGNKYIVVNWMQGSKATTYIYRVHSGEDNIKSARLAEQYYFI